MGTIGFRDRSECPCCGSTRRTSVWRRSFSDPQVATWIEEYQYSANASDALGGTEFDLVKCRDCDMLFHARVMDDAAIPIVYGNWTDQAQVARFEALHGVGSAVDTGIRRIKLALRLRHLLTSRFGEPLRWLDFGCGSGKTLDAAQVMGFDAVGLDVSASRAEVAGSGGRRIYRDFPDFDQADQPKVHAATLEQVLEHVMSPQDILRDIAAHMEPGGVLFIAVPNCTGVSVPRDFAEFLAVQPLEHVNAFTPQTLCQTAKRAGFEPIRRPMASVTSNLVGAVRSIGGLVWQPSTTEQYFRLPD